ncbi:MAG: hypothetical protein Q8914_04135 [Bacteroidota bacterium]|nr:hypothetical protein [Bacteroidota bacterium]
MKQVSITLVPIGGLCNRMRAMASGVSMAEHLDGTITVCWEKNKDCLADFGELFLPVDIERVNVKSFGRSDWYLRFSRKRNLYVPGLVRSMLFDSQLTGTAERFDDAVYEQVKGQKIYAISGYSLTRHFPLTELFRPVPELQTRINWLKSQFDSHVIGIHIRRGDNLQSIKRNSVDDYVRFMETELIERPKTRFYLATDSPEIKQQLTARFLDRIIAIDAVLDRNALQGMKDAVVDLWCLASCNRLAGSYYSSYSELAAEMGGIELTIL